MKVKEIKKLIMIFVAFVIFLPNSFCLSYQELLENYCTQDIQFEELAISLQKAELSYKQAEINNGTTVTVSSGSVNLEFDQKGLSTSFSPSVSVEIPSLSNTKAKISIPLSINNQNISMQNAGITLSTEIISSSKDDIILSAERSLRTIEEAERKLNARIIALEKAFLNELKEVYSLGLALNDAKEDLLSKEISFESIIIQGYSENSPKYRSSAMAVKSAEFDLEKAKRKYNTTLESFLSKCGAESTDISFLEIPEVDLLDILDFEKERFGKIEETVWSNYVANTSRNNKKDFTLAANTSANLSLEKESLSPTIGAGLSAAYKGFTGNLNLNFPISDNRNPSVSFSITWNPNQTKIAAFEKESASLDERKESLSLQSAYEEYENRVDEYQVEKENLLWQYEKNTEELSMYKDLAEDTEYWFNQGIVSESEYRQSISNYEKAILSVITSKIDMLIYNLDLKSLFI